MKKILTSALVIALSIGAAHAQTHKGGKHGDKAHHEMGYQKLNLSADQQAKIKAINESYRDKMKSLKDQTSLSDADRKTKRESLQQQHKAELDAVLTAEQRAQVETSKKDWKEKNKDHDGTKEDKDVNKLKVKEKDRDRSRGDMAKDLNLTAEQQAKIEAIRKENRAKLDAIRNDASLTQEQKKAKAGEIMKAQLEQMRAILTTEQQQKMKEGRKGHSEQTKKK